MVRPPLSRAAVPRAVAVALSIALVQLPVAARAPATPPAPTPSNTAIPTSSSPPSESVKQEQPLRAAIEKVNARDLQPSASKRGARRSAQATGAVKESPAFFKSGTGIVVLAAIAAGVGYAFYSVSNDRIHSPGKD